MSAASLTTSTAAEASQVELDTAAVIAGGHCGFGLGATPNAIANMDAITSNYGPAPRAFFVVSIVGAFFIDIVNAVVIQTFVSFL